jgi:hypothetical protein
MICPSNASQCNILLDLCYRKSCTKQFVWDMCGDTIILNLLMNSDRVIKFPIFDIEGDIAFAGNRFSFIEKRLDVVD